MMNPRIYSIALSTLAALVVSIVGATGVWAQDPADSIDLDSSSLSPLEFVATSTGIFGHEPVGRGPGLFFPKGSGKSYLFGSGLWFGARKGARDRQPLVFYTFNVNTGRSAATPGELIPADDPAPALLYHSVDYDPMSGLGLNSPTPVPAWPLWQDPSAGVLNASMFSPGLYEPVHYRRYPGYEGRSPAFASNADEQMVARYHDGDLRRYEIDSMQAGYLGYPIGLQIEQNIYAWELESLNQNVVVLRYQIINLSGDTLYDCVASQAAETDLGLIENDHASFYNSRPDLRTGYFWSEPEYDGPNLSLAMILVEAPVIGYDGFIDNSRRSEYRGSGRVGAFPRWTAEWSHDPLTSVERYRLMTEGGFATESGPADFRGLLASTPFSMAPGDTAHIAVAFAIVGGVPDGIVAGGDANMICRGYEQELDQVVDRITESYYAPVAVTSAPDRNHDAGSGDLLLLPNPARELTTIQFAVRSAAVVRTQISNARGEVVIERQRHVDRPGEYRQDLDLSSLASGLYIVTVYSGGDVRTSRLVVTK